MAFLSDRAKQRRSFVGGLLLLARVGFIIAIASGRPGAKYAGVFIAASGIFLSAHYLTYLVSIQPFLALFPGWRTILQAAITARREWQFKCTILIKSNI
jgi:hypothetical protein